MSVNGDPGCGAVVCKCIHTTWPVVSWEIDNVGTVTFGGEAFGLGDNNT